MTQFKQLIHEIHRRSLWQVLGCAITCMADPRLHVRVSLGPGVGKGRVRLYRFRVVAHLFVERA